MSWARAACSTIATGIPARQQPGRRPNMGLRFAHRRNRLMVTHRSPLLADGQHPEQPATRFDRGDSPFPAHRRPIAGNSLNLRPTGWNTAIGKPSSRTLAELRFNLQYQVFNKASVNVGWTGLIVDGIARPSDMINYTLPTMGLLYTATTADGVHARPDAGLHLQSVVRQQSGQVNGNSATPPWMT